MSKQEGLDKNDYFIASGWVSLTDTVLSVVPEDTRTCNVSRVRTHLP